MLEWGPKLVANPEHLDLLRQGVEVWNAWRAKEPSVRPDLSGANLYGANLVGANLSDTDLRRASIQRVSLTGDVTNLSRADFRWANLSDAHLDGANLREAKLQKANLAHTHLGSANLSKLNLSGAVLDWASLVEAKLIGTNLTRASLYGANLNRANFEGADLTGADLRQASMVKTNLADAVLVDCSIFGISAWNVNLEGAKQKNLIITDWYEPNEPKITTDDLEVAQFIHLLLHNNKIKRVIDTVGKKGVLLLGRFTEGRIVVLERLSAELRNRDYLPIVFNFDKPETKDFTGTVRLLAGLSKFVIADLTSPKSAPYELGAIVPQTMIPFQPIIAEGETPFGMLPDLWINNRDRVFEPIYYSSLDKLIASLDEKIIQPAEARFVELLKRKADTMGGEHI